MPASIVPMLVRAFCQPAHRHAQAPPSHTSSVDAARTRARSDDRTGPDQQRDCRAAESFCADREKPRSPDTAKGRQQPSCGSGTVPGAGTYPVTSSHPEEWASSGIVASITDASPHYILLANSISHGGTPLGLVRVQVTTVEKIEYATSKTNSTKGVCEAAEPLIFPSVRRPISIRKRYYL